MNVGLLRSRHPRLSDLFHAWEASGGCDGANGESALSDDLADFTVTITGAAAPIERLAIERSGAEVDALYGASLDGAMARCLTPGRDTAEDEARVVLETGRPMLVEDQVGLPGGERRLARLYLPVVKAVSGTTIVLCGVVPIALERS